MAAPGRGLPARQHRAAGAVWARPGGPTGLERAERIERDHLAALGGPMRGGDGRKLAFHVHDQHCSAGFKKKVSDQQDLSASF